MTASTNAHDYRSKCCYFYPFAFCFDDRIIAGIARPQTRPLRTKKRYQSYQFVGRTGSFLGYWLSRELPITLSLPECSFAWCDRAAMHICMQPRLTNAYGGQASGLDYIQRWAGRCVPISIIYPALPISPVCRLFHVYSGHRPRDGPPLLPWNICMVWGAVVIHTEWASLGSLYCRAIPASAFRRSLFRSCLA